MTYDNFQNMFTYYMRRKIFDFHDYQLMEQDIVTDPDDFITKILTPKMHLGRLNYGDFIRILAVI